MGTDGGAVPTNATQDKTGQRASHLFIRGSQWVHRFYNANGWSERNRQIIYLQWFFVDIYCFWQLFTKLCESMDWMSRQEEAKPVSAALVVTRLGKIPGWSLEAPSLNKLNHLQINSKSAALLGFFQPAFQVANTEIFKKSRFLHFEYLSGHGKA